MELPEHPGIVRAGTPVGRSLHDCLGFESTRKGRLKHVPTLATAAMTIAAAHARRIAHGNVTAETIIVGPFRDVYICDWQGAESVEWAGYDARLKDVEALGRILARLIEGGSSKLPLVGRVVAQGPPQLASIRDYALARRYQNAAELAHDLHGYSNRQRVHAHRPSLRDPIYAYLSGEMPTWMFVITTAIVVKVVAIVLALLVWGVWRAT